MDAPLDRPALERVARFFAVLADATRLEILQYLKGLPQAEACVSQVVQALGIKQAAASKQLAALADAGLLTRRRHGNQVFYGIGDEMVFAMCELVCGKLGREASGMLQHFAGASAIR
ncbi:MAG: transcriptional regulator [Planctomycetota bacterium]|nr:MAG: transcriptional regulator [Planctomycetota bacterium]